MHSIPWLIISEVFFAVILILAGIVIFRGIRNADFIIISGFGKSRVFNVPKSKESYGIAAPYVRPINEFLIDFANSNEEKIEFTQEDIEEGPVSSPMLRALQGMEYERVRLRLRVISNLEPIVNIDEEKGEINYHFKNLSGSLQEVKLRSLFAPKGQSILLEKL